MNKFLIWVICITLCSGVCFANENEAVDTSGDIPVQMNNKVLSEPELGIRPKAVIVKEITVPLAEPAPEEEIRIEDKSIQTQAIKKETKTIETKLGTIPETTRNIAETAQKAAEKAVNATSNIIQKTTQNISQTVQKVSNKVNNTTTTITIPETTKNIAEMAENNKKEINKEPDQENIQTIDEKEIKGIETKDTNITEPTEEIKEPIQKTEDTENLKNEEIVANPEDIFVETPTSEIINEETSSASEEAIILDVSLPAAENITKTDNTKKIPPETVNAIEEKDFPVIYRQHLNSGTIYRY